MNEDGTISTDGDDFSEEEKTIVWGQAKLADNMDGEAFDTGNLEKVRAMKRERVKVVFGNPIFTKSGDNVDDITAKTMQEIKKLLPKNY